MPGYHLKFISHPIISLQNNRRDKYNYSLINYIDNKLPINTSIYRIDTRSINMSYQTILTYDILLILDQHKYYQNNINLIYTIQL